MKKSILIFTFIAAATVFSLNDVFAQVAISIPGVKGDSRIMSHTGWLDATEISFGVSRSPASSTKGGTSDINIGVGKFSEIKIDRLVDLSSVHLFKFSVAGNSLPSATIHLLRSENGRPYAYMEIILDRIFLSSYEMSSSDDQSLEKIALRFNKIKIRYLDSRGTELSSAGWDLITNRTWR